MGTANYDIYDLLKENLMTRDDAVVWAAAGLAMGLVMIGNKSTDSLEDMLNVRDSLYRRDYVSILALFLIEGIVR